MPLAVSHKIHPYCVGSTDTRRKEGFIFSVDLRKLCTYRKLAYIQPDAKSFVMCCVWWSAAPQSASSH